MRVLLSWRTLGILIALISRLEFTGDLHTFLMTKNIGYDVKAKDFDAYISVILSVISICSLFANSSLQQLANISRDRELLRASDKLDNLQALISAVQPSGQSFFTSLLASFGSLFASKRQQGKQLSVECISFLTDLRHA